MKQSSKSILNDYPAEALLPIVKRLTEQYTSLESTSVTYETAGQLMEAVIYCIREYESIAVIQEESPEAAEQTVTQLRAAKQKLPAEEAYSQGYQAVINKTLRAKALYESLTANFNWYGNQALKDTVLAGMPGFFLRYDARFAPQDHLLTLDYPILDLWALNHLCGVDIIYEYLNCIRLEQTFLSAFPQETVTNLLLRHHRDYRSLFLNLPSVIIQEMTDEVFELKEYAASHSPSEIKTQKIRALELLLKERFGDNKELLEYLQKGLA